MIERKLQAMDIGDILDASFRLYKNNFVRFIKIVAPIYLSYFLLGIIILLVTTMIGIKNTPPSPEQLGMFFAMLIPLLLIGLFIWTLNFLAEGALVYSVSRAYLGKKISFTEAYRNIRKQFWPLIGVSTLSGLIIGIGFIMLVIPGIILALFLSLIVPIIVLEKETVGGSIGRSFELTSYSFGKVFLVGLVTLIAIFVANAAATLPFFIWGVIIGLTGGENPQVPLWTEIFASVIKYIVQLFIAPFWMIAITLLYYDIRIRKEGFDLEMMAADLEKKNKGK